MSDWMIVVPTVKDGHCAITILVLLSPPSFLPLWLVIRLSAAATPPPAPAAPLCSKEKGSERLLSQTSFLSIQTHKSPYVL